MNNPATRNGSARAAGWLALPLALWLAGCALDNPASGPAGPDAGPAAPADVEHTAALCADGEDNDGDGKTDCDDDECAIFARCASDAAPSPDASAPDAAPDAVAPDAASPDTMAPDAQAPDGASPDTSVDAQASDGASPDTMAPDAQAPDAQASDGASPDTMAPDAQAPDGASPDTSVDAQDPDGASPDTSVDAPATVCGNGDCEVGESCDGQGSTVECLADCPGVTSGPQKDQYCYVNGTCAGPGCP